MHRCDCTRLRPNGGFKKRYSVRGETAMPSTVSARNGRPLRKPFSLLRSYRYPRLAYVFTGKDKTYGEPHRSFKQIIFVPDAAKACWVSGFVFFCIFFMCVCRFFLSRCVLWRGLVRFYGCINSRLNVFVDFCVLVSFACV